MTHQDPLAGKRIVLGLTGGIAAYKAATICSRLVQAGAEVDVIMTAAAQKFIAPLTFQALTHRRVYLDTFDIPDSANIPHITLADESDLLLIAPATANTLAKLAHGLADNLLTAVALATPAPILIAPAMETDMWQHPATQANVKTLRQHGAQRGGLTLCAPAEGRLASGAMGQGRMVEPDDIVEQARLLMAQSGDLARQTIVITAGGTREAIDPVRFITNHSSGKMGYALAQAARNRGAQVVLISTVTLPPPMGVTVIEVDSAQSMLEAVMAEISQGDILVMAAAVADYRPETVASQKIKKSADGTGMAINLSRTADILAEVAALESTQRPRLTIGFAAETEHLQANAQDKLRRKKLDMIVANDVSAADAGFGVDTNRVILFMADGSAEALPLMSKLEVAHAILDKVVITNS